MTEEDTFNRLKRLPYDEVRPKVISLYATYRAFTHPKRLRMPSHVEIKLRELLAMYHWNLEDFENAYQLRIK